MTKSWHADAAHRMRQLYGERSNIKGIAVTICYRSEWAAQYIEQCPVLPLFMTIDERGRFSNKVPDPDEIHRIFAVRPKLKTLMKKYGLPFPMRKLHARAIDRNFGDVLRALVSMQPSALSQSIPVSHTAQRRWLSRLSDWLARTRRGVPLAAENFPWAARELGRLQDYQVSDVNSIADYVRQMDGPINPSWTWENLHRASQDWHAAQFHRGGLDFGENAYDALQYAMRALQNDITITRTVPADLRPDTVLDKGDHPDTVELHGISFVALRTPQDLGEEGYAMQHCVATYVGRVAGGYCRIISLRHGEQRLATMEVDHERIVQIKGFRNAIVPSMTVEIAQRYVETYNPRRHLRGRTANMRLDPVRVNDLIPVHYDADAGTLRVEHPARRGGRTMQIEQAVSASAARLRAELERRMMDVFREVIDEPIEIWAGPSIGLRTVRFPLLQREETPGVEIPSDEIDRVDDE